MKRNKLKKRRNRLLLKRKLVLTSTLVLLFVIGLGYSLLSVNLNLNGNITVKEYLEPTLYNVMKKAYDEGYTREYTGQHQDSMVGVGTKKIYYWDAPNTTEGNTLATEILDKNNVMFANYCWQMIRTTDTGGVKLIYNGEVENNQCLNTRSNHVGYSSMTTITLANNQYYGTSYTYDKTTGLFTLAGTVTTGSINVDQYTCRKTSASETCTTLFLVNQLVSGNTYSAISLSANTHYSQIGKANFNHSKSLAYVGYMYNGSYENQERELISEESMLANMNLNINWYYADSYTYISGRGYTLNNPSKVQSTDDFPSLIGKYTLGSSDANFQSYPIRYIADVSGTTMYYISLSNGNSLNYYNHAYTYGDNYIDNGNGTYTITNPTTVNKTDWKTVSENIGQNRYICKNATNNTCSDPWYFTSVSFNKIKYVQVANNYKYAKGFTYNNGTYTLNSDSIQLWKIANGANNSNISKYHYTCNNVTGTCTTLTYIYYMADNAMRYIELTDGKSIGDAMSEMLNNDNVNATDSHIKEVVDIWYKHNLISYTDKLEDTIFCNDRYIYNLAGWNPNNGDVTSHIKFNNYKSNFGLSCTYTTDKFSVTNNKAKLNYPVGLITEGEVELFDNNIIIATGNDYWTMSPKFVYYDGNVYLGYVTSNGGEGSSFSHSTNIGVRPVISLKPGTEYTSGTGSMSDPYRVEVNT